MPLASASSRLIKVTFTEASAPNTSKQAVQSVSSGMAAGRRLVKDLGSRATVLSIRKMRLMFRTVHCKDGRVASKYEQFNLPPPGFGGGSEGLDCFQSQAWETCYEMSLRQKQRCEAVLQVSTNGE